MKKTIGKKHKIWLTILLVLVIFLGSICIVGMMVFKHYYGMMNIEKNEDTYAEQPIVDFEDEEMISDTETDTLQITNSEDTERVPEETETIPDTETTETLPVTNREEPEQDSEIEEIVYPDSTEDETAAQTTKPQAGVVTTTEENKIMDTTQEMIEFLEGVEISERIFRVMLIGVDSRQDNVIGRSDTMILFDINPDTKKIVMTSILRDIQVDIPGYGGNRLNASYAFGGAKLLFKTIAGSFGIDIEKYVAINFWIVRDVVDAFGGVDINVTEEEIEEINRNLNGQSSIMKTAYGTDHLSPDDAGTITLNGNQALAYARIRYIDSDFGRTARQRNVVTACLEKLKKMNISQINGMLEEILPRVTTNLTEKDILTLLVLALNRKDYSIESMTIPVSGTWEYARIQNRDVIQVDYAANTKAWYTKITEK